MRAIAFALAAALIAATTISARSQSAANKVLDWQDCKAFGTCAALDKISAEAKKLGKKRESALRLPELKPLQDRLLRAGIDAMVYAGGDRSETVRIAYIGFTRPVLFQMVEDGKFIRQIIDELKPLGFKKLLLTDGYSASELIEVR